MKITPWLLKALPFALLLAAPIIRADDDIRVDVVVDMTDAGENAPKASPEHPVYYFPWTAGYVERGGGELLRQKPPPPAWDVQHGIALALAKKGYFVTKPGHYPAIVLILWWGYITPTYDSENSYTGGSPFQPGPGSIYVGGGGLGLGQSASPGGGPTQPGGLQGGIAQPYGYSQPNGVLTAPLTAAGIAGEGMLLPGAAFIAAPDEHQMMLLVAGDEFPDDLGRVHRYSDELYVASHHARYFLMVSALDFKQALHKKPVLLWCARVSTELAGRSLSEVLPTLIERGTPCFGEDTGGPKFLNSAPVPRGFVTVGQPILKSMPAK